MRKSDILLVIGTRPELIKMAPIVKELQKIGYDNYSVVDTGQHKDMLSPYWQIFGFKADYELDIILPGQNLSSLTARAIQQLSNLMDELKYRDNLPGFILAQGDTTTVMAASMVAFYYGIKFMHIEAGLRTFDLQQPFPEEFNRRVTAITSHHHFAPSEKAKLNLLNESVPESMISVVGNTIVDSVELIISTENFKKIGFADLRVDEAYHSGKDIVIITCHRRENQNQNLVNIIESVAELANREPDTFFVWPVHPNPNIKIPVLSSACSTISNVILTQPLDYVEKLKLLQRSKLALSDSGGIQEEAPSFKVPVLVLRNSTERPEAVEKGFSMIVGADRSRIVDSFFNFKPDYENSGNPYGDGLAGKRIVDRLLRELSESPRNSKRAVISE